MSLASDLQWYCLMPRGSPRPDVMKPFSISTQLSMKFILLINAKMSTIVGILTFISMINDRLWGFKPEIYIDYGYLSIKEQFKFHAQLS